MLVHAAQTMKSRCTFILGFMDIDASNALNISRWKWIRQLFFYVKSLPVTSFSAEFSFSLLVPHRGTRRLLPFVAVFYVYAEYSPLWLQSTPRVHFLPFFSISFRVSSRVHHSAFSGGLPDILSSIVQPQHGVHLYPCASQLVYIV
jgi:hypothetical protein